ncbi:MAG: BNR repeat-containing protein [Hyphomonadaceae bacterium]|nr:BNR repeat-containing protein [Hyphomonadaceae bacterium]
MARVLEVVDRVWSGHSVKFALAVTDERVFAGYYDAGRQLIVAARTGLGEWVRQPLDTHVGWDSHNGIAIGLDGSGRLHVAANMHRTPLVYFMSAPGGDVRTLAPVSVMVDADLERYMTYPAFIRDAQGRLVFHYRDGRSGNGREIWNIFDEATASWRPLISSPMIDGQGRMNAYVRGPVLGPDGWFHLAWVWRNSSMAETNHDLSYAKSPDLVRWFRSDGAAYDLPITFDTAEIVDPVPTCGGMINNNTVIGFDGKGRVMITYHKFDEAGCTQVFVARREADGWRKAVASRWSNYRWDFSGRGAIDFEVIVSGAEPDAPGLIRVAVERGRKPTVLIVESGNLNPVEERHMPSLGEQLEGLAAIPEGMILNRADDNGMSLVWATRPKNRDAPYNDVSAPTELNLMLK